MKIIFDTLGADKTASEIIKGGLQANEELGITPLFIGNKEEIETELEELSIDKDKFEIIDAKETITNMEDPALAIRRKKSSSIVVGMNLLKDKKADAFISAGSTGAILAGGTFLVGRIDGVKRAFLPTNIPNLKGFTVLLDSGANMDVPAENLLQFAKVGSAYAKTLGIDNPRVGLINVGAEEEKGNAQTKSAHQLLKEARLNFIGNVEARDLAMGVCDVAVCDGFVGNVILKNTEGNAIFFLKAMETMLSKLQLDELSAQKIQGGLKEFSKKLSYEEHGGTILLGLKEIIVKAHGSSSARAIKNAAKQALKFHEQGLIKKIEDELGGNK